MVPLYPLVLLHPARLIQQIELVLGCIAHGTDPRFGQILKTRPGQDGIHGIARLGIIDVPAIGTNIPVAGCCGHLLHRKIFGLGMVGNNSRGGLFGHHLHIFGQGNADGLRLKEGK